MESNLKCVLYLLVLLFFKKVVSQTCTNKELVMVQMIVRHGDLAPVKWYPKDPHPKEIWKEGLEDLTQLGKVQSFVLGQYLRSLYEDFITTDPNEVNVMSSYTPDSLKSSQAFLASLYKPNSEWKVIQDLPWQPIFIEQDKPNGEKFLSRAACPAAEKEYERLLKEIEPHLQNYENLMQYWSLNSGLDIKNVNDAESLFGTLYTEVLNNYTVPNWALNYWDQLKYLHSLAFRLRIKSKLLQRLRGGPLVGLTIDRMKKKMSGDLQKTKVLVYTTHGMNIAAYLSAMDMWNELKPKACSSILIEMYNKDNEAFVRYLYLNSTTPQKGPQPLHLLTVPGCGEFCPLEHVIRKAETVVPENWEEECRTTE